MTRNQTKDNGIKIVRVTKKMLFAAVIIVALWGGSLIALWNVAKNKFQNQVSPQNGTAFPLLNPRLQTFGLDTPEERAAKLLVTFSPLKQKLLEYLGPDKDNVAFYVEDLNTGGWMGWQEREEFIPASLLKVPLAVGAMKEVDEGNWTLDSEFLMDARYKDKNFGSLWQVEDGTALTLRRLIEEMLQYSDNTAANILFDKLSSEERDNIYYHIGIINPEAPFEQAANRPVFRKLTPKDLATMFRAIFNATYLTRRSSQYILDTLTKTKFDKTLASEIPPDIKVAHKVANFFVSDPKRPKNYHDCGIAYLPKHPYLYCVMTQDRTAEAAQRIIVDIGNKIYRYFSESGI
ncbi:MAG: serine hydrolase [bacterium]|nr:serine hydrolase [bacterium]